MDTIKSLITNIYYTNVMFISTQKQSKRSVLLMSNFQTENSSLTSGKFSFLCTKGSMKQMVGA